MSWRNRIVGGVAVVFGLAVVTLIVIDGRWDNHDTTKPLKAFLGGLAFAGLGAWYLVRGAKAESWRSEEVPENPDPHTRIEGLKVSSTFADLESHSSFSAECKKIEAEMKERAAEMERTLEAEPKSKA